MSRAHGDQPGTSRPPTPYPFSSDPTWGTLGVPRGRYYYLDINRPRAPARRSASIRERPHRFYRYGAPHLTRHLTRQPRPYRDYGLAAEQQSGAPTSAPAPTLISAAPSRDSAVRVPAESSTVQSRIDAQNSEIAARPPRLLGSGSNTIDLREKEKHVRFRLTRQAELHPIEEIEEEFDRLRIQDSRRPVPRCSLCGQELRG